MHTKILLAGAALTAAALFSTGALASTNIVQNGDFETGVLGPWVVNAAASDPWTIGPYETPAHSGNFDVQSGCVGAACTDPSNPALANSLSQALTTDTGAVYDLTFWFGGAGTPDELKVLWGSTVAIDLVNSQIVDNAAQGETEYEVSGLIAHSASTTLTFLGRQDPGYSGLDDISVVETAASSGAPGVPEPATWALMIGGFFGAGSVLRRRRAVVA